MKFSRIGLVVILATTSQLAFADELNRGDTNPSNLAETRGEQAAWQDQCSKSKQVIVSETTVVLSAGNKQLGCWLRDELDSNYLEIQGMSKNDSLVWNMGGSAYRLQFYSKIQGKAYTAICGISPAQYSDPIHQPMTDADGVSFSKSCKWYNSDGASVAAPTGFRDFRPQYQIAPLAAQSQNQNKHYDELPAESTQARSSKYSQRPE